MRVFFTDEEWSQKLNVVDDNNLLVGYDWGQCCCENFDYDFRKTKDDPNSLNEQDLEGWFFLDEIPEEESEGEWDSNNLAFFKIHNPVTEEEGYLVLSNCHNGYYSHGFAYSGGELFQGSGYL